MVQPPQAHNHGKIWQQWERWILLILMMIIGWVMNISSRSPKVDWASLTNTTPHVAKQNNGGNQKTNCILDTLLTEYAQQALTHASRIFHSAFCAHGQIHMMILMREFSMRKAEQDHKAIMYLAYITHQRLCSIRGNKIQLTQNPAEW